MSGRLLVLGWHNIAPTWGFPDSGDAYGEAFARQLATLRRHATVVPLRPALDAVRAGRRLPPRAVALTFDDGYRDHLDLAVPILRGFRMPATFFLVTGFCAQRSRIWWEELGWAFGAATATTLTWDGVTYDLAAPGVRDRTRAAVAEALKALTAADRLAAVEELAARLAPRGTRPGPEVFADWDAARALRDAGHAIGSHTATHPVLARETAPDQARELAGSREELERELSVAADVLAYPNGRAADYDVDTLESAVRAGYRFALTTETGLVTPRGSDLEVRRFVLEPRTRARDIMRELRWLAADTVRAALRARS
ncbi:MAG TPA: polysaccharide deacetylase family protein [Streptosporangiaceae bacterium]|jgi:peptidoglycan/xylan/chitin deacetylase (PgdA/CDA1 family)